MTPATRLHEESIAHLRPSGARNAVAAVAKAAEEAVAQMDRLEPGTYGVGRGDLVSPKAENAIRDEIDSIAACFGIESGELYVGGNDASQVAAVPGKKTRVAWIVGDAVRPPLRSARRFVVGQLAMAIHEGVLPYVQRRPEDAASVVHAAAIAAEVPLSGGASRPGVAELARALERKMSRRTKRAVADAVAVAGGADADQWASAAIRSALRAGLLLSGDLRVALAAVLGEPGTPETVLASPIALDLLTFWLSPSMLALRREVGISR